MLRMGIILWALVWVLSYGPAEVRISPPRLGAVTEIVKFQGLCPEHISPVEQVVRREARLCIHTHEKDNGLGSQSWDPPASLLNSSPLGVPLVYD
jgi:hypothetical protein